MLTVTFLAVCFVLEIMACRPAEWNGYIREARNKKDSDESDLVAFCVLKNCPHDDVAPVLWI